MPKVKYGGGSLIFEVVGFIASTGHGVLCLDAWNHELQKVARHFAQKPGISPFPGSSSFDYLDQ